MTRVVCSVLATGILALVAGGCGDDNEPSGSIKQASPPRGGHGVRMLPSPAVRQKVLD